MKNKKQHILFVDDEPSILETFQRLLFSERQVWNLFFAANADAALEIANQNDLDAIVIDVRMPGKDGFELLLQLRSQIHTAKLPAILVTGDSEPSLKAKALNLGATDLLSKPIRKEDLIARIKSSLRIKEYQDQIEQQVITLDYKVKERTQALELSQREIILRLAKACEYRDDETGNHIMRVACYSRLLAELDGRKPDFLETIFLASTLHDVGKIGIPDQILLKNGPLTPDERSTIQTHSAIGANILAEKPMAFNTLPNNINIPFAPAPAASVNPFLNMAVNIAKSHHERWDGNGYPEKIAQNAIPDEARIVAIADVFDALTSVRPYKKAFSFQDSVRILQEEAAKHFDPRFTQIFLENLDVFAQLYSELRKSPPQYRSQGTPL